MNAITAAWRVASRVLDRVYFVAGVIAAAFLVLLLVIVALQVSARWIGVGFPGSTNYAGYCMAASSFFALAYALSRHAHIRVHFLLNALGARRVIGEIWCHAIAAPLATWFAWFAIRGNFFSHTLNDISQGQDATPLWLPQLAMSTGAVLVAVALWDGLLRSLLFGSPSPPPPSAPSPSSSAPSPSTTPPSPSAPPPPPSTPSLSPSTPSPSPSASSPSSPATPPAPSAPPPSPSTPSPSAQAPSPSAPSPPVPPPSSPPPPLS